MIDRNDGFALFSEAAEAVPAACSTVSFGFTILGSGSKGNSAVIHGPQGNLLLDAGFSAKEICRRMEQRAIDPASIRALLITHEHSDHIQGCRTFADKFGIPVYATPDTFRAMQARKNGAADPVLITSGNAFELCGITVEPFTISHDVVDAVAYIFRAGSLKLGYATDLGCINHLAVNKLRDCNALVLEANYEPEYLRNSPRPLQLKRRIMSRHGHLSNQDAMATLSDILSERTRRLVFAHLSHECNCPDLVARMAAESLKDLNRTDISVDIASQEEPLQTYWIMP